MNELTQYVVACSLGIMAAVKLYDFIDFQIQVRRANERSEDEG